MGGSDGLISEVLRGGFLASRRSIFEFFVRMIMFSFFCIRVTNDLSRRINHMWFVGPHIAHEIYIFRSKDNL